MIISTLNEFLFNSDVEKNALIQSNYIVSGIVISYLLFVKRFGPAIMKNRKPMDLRHTIIIFNSLVIAINLYLCYTAWTFFYKFWPVRCYLKHNPAFIAEQKVYGYIALQGLLIKIVELLDTVFFVLRKKYNQASFLHNFHHSVVVLVTWGILKRRQVGFYMLLAASINFGVHVLTYLYYTMTAIGPHMQKYLWWKKYLTVVQIMQFFVVMFYLGYSFVTGCEDFALFEMITFIGFLIVCILFFNFYAHAYRKKKEKEST